MIYHMVVAVLALGNLSLFGMQGCSTTLPTCKISLGCALGKQVLDAQPNIQRPHTLKLERCCIAVFHGIADLKVSRCKVLSLAYNHLANFSYFEAINPNVIEELDLHGNAIEFVPEQELLMLAEKCPKLKRLDLRENPVKGHQIRQQAPQGIPYQIAVDEGY